MNQSPQLLPAPGKSRALAGLKKALFPSEILTQPGQVQTEAEQPLRLGLLIAFLVFGVFGVWSVLAPIEGSAFAPGVVRVKSNNKMIQHLDGGLVKEIRVQNGEVVKAGDVLVVLDSTQEAAQLEIYAAQLAALLALEARLLAERDNADTITWPAELPNTDQGLQERHSQELVFSTRKASRDGETTILEQRIGQLQSRIEGLKAMQESKTILAQSFAEELADVRTLLDRGFEIKQRLRDLERNHAQQLAEAADLSAQIAAAEINIGETRQQILQLQNDFQKEVAEQLPNTRVDLQNTRERVIALRDILDRTDIRAPEAGVVNGLRIHTEGGVIGPGSIIAEIVPQSDNLVIESRVAVTDIDRVAVGQEALVRFSAFNSKTVPQLAGTVITVSADRLTDEATQQPYYAARIELTPESLAALEGLTLVPGMPADSSIKTGSRTFLEYLTKPLSNSMARSFRED